VIFPDVITIGTLTTRTLRTAADLPSVMSTVIALCDNNRNADDADLADCRGFAECGVRFDTNGHVEGITLGKIRDSPPCPRRQRSNCYHGGKNHVRKISTRALYVCHPPQAELSLYGYAHFGLIT